MARLVLLMILGLMLIGSVSCNEANAGFGKRPVMKGAYQQGGTDGLAGGREGDPHKNAKRRGDSPMDDSSAGTATGGSGGSSDCGTGG